MNKIFFLAFFLFVTSIALNVWAVNDAGMTASAGKKTTEIETEGYYLVKTSESLGDETPMKCDCACGKFCKCPPAPFCDCPVSPPVLGILHMTGLMQKMKMELPIIKNTISHEDYLPFIFEYMALSRNEEDQGKIRVMSKKIFDEVLKGAAGRKPLQQWTWEAFRLPSSAEEGKRMLEKWEYFYWNDVPPEEEMQQIAYEIVMNKANNLKHISSISNYALGAAFLTKLDSGKTEADNAMKRISDAQNFQERFQRIGEIELQSAQRLSEIAKLNAKVLELSATKAIPKVISYQAHREGDEIE